MVKHVISRKHIKIHAHMSLRECGQLCIVIKPRWICLGRGLEFGTVTVLQRPVAQIQTTGPRAEKGEALAHQQPLSSCTSS